MQYPEEKSNFVFPSINLQNLATRSHWNQQVEISALLKDGYDADTLVDWYGTNDLANPVHWSSRKRLVVAALIFLYTVTVAVGSSVYLVSEPGLRLEYNVSEQQSLLPLSLYVLGCR